MTPTQAIAVDDLREVIDAIMTPACPPNGPGAAVGLAAGLGAGVSAAVGEGAGFSATGVFTAGAFSPASVFPPSGVCSWKDGAGRPITGVEAGRWKTQ